MEVLDPWLTDRGTGTGRTWTLKESPVSPLPPSPSSTTVSCEPSRPRAYRSAFVLDGEGRVVWSWATEDDSVLPDPDAVRAALERARP